MPEASEICRFSQPGGQLGSEPSSLRLINKGILQSPLNHQPFLHPPASAVRRRLIGLARRSTLCASTLRGYRAQQGKPCFFLQYRVNSKRVKEVFQGATHVAEVFRGTEDEWLGLQNVCRLRSEAASRSPTTAPSIIGMGARPEITASTKRRVLSRWRRGQQSDRCLSAMIRTLRMSEMPNFAIAPHLGNCVGVSCPNQGDDDAKKSRPSPKMLNWTYTATSMSLGMKIASGAAQAEKQQAYHPENQPELGVYIT